MSEEGHILNRVSNKFKKRGQAVVKRKECENCDHVRDI
jgi:hypothetical protein